MKSQCLILIKKSGLIYPMLLIILTGKQIFILHFVTKVILSVKIIHYVKFLSFALLLDSHETIIRTVIGTVIRVTSLEQLSLAEFSGE